MGAQVINVQPKGNGALSGVLNALLPGSGGVIAPKKDDPNAPTQPVNIPQAPQVPQAAAAPPINPGDQQLPSQDPNAYGPEAMARRAQNQKALLNPNNY